MKAIRSFQRSAKVSSRAFSTFVNESTVSAFRRFGHLEAQLDPLGLLPRQPRPELAEAIAKSPADAELLRQVYCGPLGAEFEHMESAEERQWFASMLETLVPEGKPGSFELGPGDKRNILSQLTQAEQFEQFLAKKHNTLKRYGGEGSESMYPAVRTVIAASAAAGVQDVVIGQAHRGRLALQVTFMRYPARKLFWKIRGNDEFPQSVQGIDDVSSHIACSSDLDLGTPYGSGKDLSTAGGAPVHVSFLPNPSHLEAVNPVAMGKVRAKQDNGSKDALCLLIHGDAAVAGQGVVAETCLLSRVPGYDVGGTIHLITNNRVGFTAEDKYGRSSTYASDFAKVIGAPVLHVNAESVRDVVLASRIAADYRAKFKKDVVIDIIGYRKHGHNEVDEPAFTNPIMYKNIRARKSYPRTYADQLIEEGVITQDAYDKMVKAINDHLEAEFQAADAYTKEDGSTGKGAGELGSGTHVVGDGSAFAKKWANMRQATPEEVGSSPNTGVGVDTLKKVGAASVTTPEGFDVHRRLVRAHVNARQKALGLDGNSDTTSIDWATAEALAFGTLLSEGHDVRMSGQDVERGTFSHRHAVLHDQETGEKYIPLNNMSDNQGQLRIFSSPLSELAVMGFELGYSWESPNPLVLWEAQFGDFANGAQIMIDQFLSGSESKWLRQTGLTLLLPHGYDGAGPEHSSSRIERFLQLANSQAWARGAESILNNTQDKSVIEGINMLVLNPSTPANYFHALRRQAKQPFRKPCVVIAPKVLIRHPQAVSTIEELGDGTAFKPVLREPEGTVGAPALGEAKRMILCSGKIYYDLVEKRAKLIEKGNDVAKGTTILRIEQLSPWPTEDIKQAIADAGLDDSRFLWVQEEPANAGAYTWAEAHFAAHGIGHLEFIGRPALAAPAVGLSKANSAQAEYLLNAAFMA